MNINTKIISAILTEAVCNHLSSDSGHTTYTDNIIENYKTLLHDGDEQSIGDN